MFGAIALAANQITTSVTMALYMLPLGMAAAVGIRIAQAVGASDVGACWPLGRAALLAVSAWMALVSLALWLLGAEIAGLFGVDEAIVAAAASSSSRTGPVSTSNDEVGVGALGMLVHR